MLVLLFEVLFSSGFIIGAASLVLSGAMALFRAVVPEAPELSAVFRLRRAIIGLFQVLFGTGLITMMLGFVQFFFGSNQLTARHDPPLMNHGAFVYVNSFIHQWACLDHRARFMWCSRVACDLPTRFQTHQEQMGQHTQ